jgi:signal transduction histidine kinase
MPPPLKRHHHPSSAFWKRLALGAGAALLVWDLAAGLAAADTEPVSAAEPLNAQRLLPAIEGPECVELPVNVDGQVLWRCVARHELILQTAAGVLPVKMDLVGQPDVEAGDEIRLQGRGMAGQGCLDAALVDNDGLHGPTTRSGSVTLASGLHPIRAEWFNRTADFMFKVEYSGPNLPRQVVPDGVLFRTGPATNVSSAEPGLDYRCFQGGWELLPHWADWMPVKSGLVQNFDLGARVQDYEVGLQFNGYLRIDQPGDYTFWTTSDDGSRLFLEEAPLQIEKLGLAALPVGRQITPGQRLAPHEDCFWAQMSGMVTGEHLQADGDLEIEVTGETGATDLEMDAGGPPPELFSRIQATGLCRSTPWAKGGWIAGRLLSPRWVVVEQAPIAKSQPSTLNIAKLRDLAASGQRTAARLSLTGLVLTAASPQGIFALQDETGGVLVRRNPRDEPVAPGQRINLAGSGALAGDRLLISDGALVDNDLLHLRRERSGSMYLHAGRVPVHACWFNRTGAYVLEIYYQGPGVPRQKIPNAALVHAEMAAGTGAIRWAPGLHFASYHGDWQAMPSTAMLAPAAAGLADNFNADAGGPADKEALEFSGFLEIPRDGQYIFTVVSDDGGLLYVDEQIPQIQHLGSSPLPAPLAIVPRQLLEQKQNYRWAEAEGEINFAYNRDGSLFLELGSEYGPINVEVADGADGAPQLLLGSRASVRGFCRGGLTPGGQQMAANFLVPGIKQILMTKPAAAQWSRYPLRSIREALEQIGLPNDQTIVNVRGTVQPGAFPPRINDGSGSLAVETLQPWPTNLTGTVNVIGRLARFPSNLVLQCSLWRQDLPPGKPDSTKLPLLGTILQIKQLTREQAKLGYPIKIRGVITLVRGTGTGFILQDDTSAIDVWWPPHSSTSLPLVGDYWEVEGNTFAEFSPNIQISRATRLGPGIIPDPLHPAWDQLLNGSLDTRYVELQGIVTGVETNGITLFTRAGKIGVLLSPLPSEPLEHYKNAVLRIRGCVVPIRNEASYQVEVGHIRLSNVALSVEEPAPADLFATQLKHPSELLLFDARAGSLQRVRIAGQVLHVQGGMFFLQDGTNAVRVQPVNPTPVVAGDGVDVVGFPELGGPSPLLREAVVRRKGVAPLPEPRLLASDALFAAGQDGRLVALQARLIGMSGNRRERVLELQAGNREFAARVCDPAGLLDGVINGSRLELSGVYSELGGAEAADRGNATFELLLNSPGDVKVLARPPWWTLRRVLMFAGSLVVVILAGIFWIVSLKQQVRENAARLTIEVRRRERIQEQIMLDKERTRIARDMHDQLGTNVTQVGLLAELTRKDAGDRDQTTRHAGKISERAIELGRTLDEIVWAVNPKNDSLDKFCDYVAIHAQELFELTTVLCRVDLPPEMPAVSLSAELRHNLFLATKEALNNIVRHANAHEVWIRFQWVVATFEISIVDDGQGFLLTEEHSRRNGMQNMKKRLEDAAGHFTVTSRPGRGTQVTFAISLAPPPAESRVDGH